MNILIVGAGVVGYTLAKHLSLEQHDIAIVDHHDTALADIQSRLDVLTVRGDATRGRILQDAGIDNADMVIAVTDNDSVNLMICLLASRLGKPTCRKVARVRNPDLMQNSRAETGATGTIVHHAPGDDFVDLMINPDTVVVQMVKRFIEAPGATEAADFMDGQIQLRKFVVPDACMLSHRRMVDLAELQRQEPFLVTAIARDGQTIIPSGNDLIEPGDEVFILMRDGVLPFILGTVGQTFPDREGRILLGGMTDASMTLAQDLAADGYEVALIENDRRKALTAGTELSGVRVFEGKATNREILMEAGADVCTFFAALSESDEMNLLAALLARHLGAQRTLLMTREVEYLPVLGHLGVDIALNARLLTMGAILRYVRRGVVQSVAKFHHDTAEAIEIVVEKGAKVCGKPLKDLGLPRGVLVGAVMRGDNVNIASGATVIEPGDRVIVFVLAGSLHRMEQLFTRRAGLFR